MWICPQCEESLEDNFDSCWRCGTGKDGTPPADPERYDPQNEAAYLSGNTLSKHCLQCGGRCVVSGSLHRRNPNVVFTPEEYRLIWINLSFTDPDIEVSKYAYICLKCGFLWAQIDPHEALKKISQWGTQDLNNRIAQQLADADILLRPSEG